MPERETAVLTGGWRLRQCDLWVPVCARNGAPERDEAGLSYAASAAAGPQIRRTRGGGLCDATGERDGSQAGGVSRAAAKARVLGEQIAMNDALVSSPAVPGALSE